MAPIRLLVLASALATAAGYGTHYDGDDFESLFGAGGEAGKCKPFSCAKGKEAVPSRLALKAKSGGCDSMSSGGISMFTATNNEETPVDACCDRRQACDHICGTSQKFCDAELKSCVEGACAAAADPEACDKKKGMVTLMQSMDQSACNRHAKAQVAACKCVDPAEAGARRLKVLKTVYEKEGGDASKAEGLAKKADTPRKFGALLHKLVAKFPKMIKKVKDPQAAYWENLMKESREKESKKPPPPPPSEPDVVEEDGGGDEEEDVEDLDTTDEL